MAESTGLLAGGAADIFGGAEAAAAAEGAFSAADIASGALSVGDALSQGASVGQLIQAGAPIGDLIEAGVSVGDLTAAGATAEQIASATPILEAAAQGAESIPFQLADGSMGSIQGGNILDAAGNVVAKGGVGTTLGDLAGYAKTGAQIVGGLGQLAGGAKMLGGTGVKPQQADPYAAYRSQAASQLQNLLANPNTITSTPGYQFNLQQGLQTQQAQQAAQGRLVSGGALLQAQQFGQQYATSNLQQQQALLSQLSGATQAPGTGATAQQNIAQSNIGGFAGGLSALATGAQGVLNPLQTLYSQYNQSSPSVS